MHPYKIGRLLASEPSLQPVVEKALKIGALSRLCVDYLPPELAARIRVANLKDGQLSILAATPAAAAKLKLLSESLCKYLSEQGPKVNSVSVRVQPAPEQANSRRIAHKKQGITPAALAALQSLYARLRESPARTALKILLDHQVQGGFAGSAAKSPRGAADPPRPPEPRRRARR